MLYKCLSKKIVIYGWNVSNGSVVLNDLDRRVSLRKKYWSKLKTLPTYMG